MKKLLVLLLMFHLFYPAFNQGWDCDVPSAQQLITGNNIGAMVHNDGSLFSIEDRQGFWFPYQDGVIPLEDQTATIFTTGLWMAATGPDQIKRLAIEYYGALVYEYDYGPGPLNPQTGDPYDVFCPYFDRIWMITREEIEEHLLDFADNGLVDNPVGRIMRWPGNANPYGIQYNSVPIWNSLQGWAPFYDRNRDGIYDPLAGDYPHPPKTIPELHPETMTWCVFHDNRPHEESNALPLKAEVQLTTWNFSCGDQYILNNSILASYKIINRSGVRLDSLHIGMFVDFQIGCFTDDYVGSNPASHSFFGYNAQEEDAAPIGRCNQGIPVYGDSPPVQSVTFLNQPMLKFMYFNNPGVVDELPPPTGTPQRGDWRPFYNLLTGHWLDGSPLLRGSHGYQSGEPADFAFPNNPNDPTGWSALTANLPKGDYQGVGVIYFDQFAPGSTKTVDLAFTAHRRPNYRVLENVERMYYDVDYIRQMYNQQFNGYCEGIATSVTAYEKDVFRIYPNPAKDFFIVEHGATPINKIRLLNVQGQEVADITGPPGKSWSLVPVKDLPGGIYFIQIQAGKQSFSRKILVKD